MSNGIDLQELARQLSCPSGDYGKEIGEIMNTNNFGMTKKTIDSLQLKNKDHLLELGHGNCKHLDYVLKQANFLSYIGLEVSELMKNNAQQNNSHFLNTDIRFELFDGNKINFHEKRFDKIFTVNTLYFWEDPESFLKEIYRVLKFDGLFSLTFSTSSFMKTLPFTEFGFKLYSENEVINLLKMSNFKIEKIDCFIENVISKSGDEVERESINIVVSK
ncbi:class I SAM-dependent methyltransferase [Chishuiella sp.]|uniref:class I SAM-dependent methyltransferase n=1 Tax=Chishuiella sp. TaxID=1969467 RepID=UPI0028A92A55|nr:class I SAM-dependent methyltransferase [Chishuiella sp.]